MPWHTQLRHLIVIFAHRFPLLSIVKLKFNLHEKCTLRKLHQFRSQSFTRKFYKLSFQSMCWKLEGLLLQKSKAVVFNPSKTHIDRRKITLMKFFKSHLTQHSKARFTQVTKLEQITQNAAFAFFRHFFVLLTLFDRKFQILKISPNWSLLPILMNFCPFKI